MKKLLFIMTLILGGSGVLLAMETVERAEQIKIETSDSKEFEIPLEVAKKSITLRNMLQGVEGLQDNEPTSLADITTAQWEKVYELMKIDSAEELKKTLVSLSPDQLVEIVPPINFLDIFIDSSSVPNELETTQDVPQANRLLFYAMQELNQRINRNEIDLETCDGFCSYLNKEIIENMIAHFGLNKYRLEGTFEGHTDWVRSVSWSPDGRKLASASDDRTIMIWNTDSLQELATLEGHENWVFSVCWSPDGRKLASGSEDKTIKIWNTDSLQELATLEGHENWVFSVCWSPDGRKLASGSEDKTIKIWDADSWKELQTLSGHKNRVRSVSWSPDGRKLASASDDRTIKIWAAYSWEKLATLEGHTDWVFSISWSPVGNKLASGSWDRTIKIWDADSCKELATLKGHGGVVLSVVWSPNGNKLALGSGDKTIKIWGASTWQELATLEGHTNCVFSVSWSPDGSKLASGSDNNTIKIWDVPYDIPQELYTIPVLRAYSALKAIKELKLNKKEELALNQLSEILKSFISKQAERKLKYKPEKSFAMNQAFTH